MLTTRAWPTVERVGAAFAAVVFAVVFAAARPAQGAVAGFSGNPASATLGQALDFAVGVRLEGGQSLTPECVTVEVTFGDRRLLAGQFRTLVEATGADTARIRVVSAQAVDEPLVAVQVNAGCGSRVARRFVLMADPPVAAPAPFLPQMATLPSVAEAGELSFNRAAGPGPDATPGAAVTQPVPEAVARPVSTRAASRAARGASVGGFANAGAAQALADAVAQAAAPRPRAVAKLRPRRAVVATQSRLKLEPAEPAAARRVAPADTGQIIEEAIEAVAQAASAARATAAAASASAERIAALERSVDKLGIDARASQALLAQSRDRIQRAEEAARWTLPLAAAVLVLGGLAVWQSLRLRTAQRGRETQWQAAAAPRPTAEPKTGKHLTVPVPFVTAATRPAAAAFPGTRPFENAPTPERWAAPPRAPDTTAATLPLVPPPPDPSTVRTDLLPPRAAVDEGNARDVSIEELIDLEQQAEFFVVLGQDEAAVELLNEHSRQTGGGSPLPYLKLLEIHRRRGDRADYEAMRTRFNHRFNAYAPEWDFDMQAGRSLEDYPGVIPRLQDVWSRPMDAMAELEALLFRKSRGELFELPAYREVLFLYALARDLLDRESAGSGDVDLLLPLSIGSGFGATEPAPFMGLGETAPQAAPSATVDFDLTIEADRQTSIFDSLGGDRSPSRRR
jgi:hypothetical protein